MQDLDPEEVNIRYITVHASQHKTWFSWGCKGKSARRNNYLISQLFRNDKREFSTQTEDKSRPKSGQDQKQITRRIRCALIKLR